MTYMPEVFTIVSTDRDTGIKLVEKTSNTQVMTKTATENAKYFPYVVVYSDVRDEIVMKFVRGYQVV